MYGVPRRILVLAWLAACMLSVPAIRAEEPETGKPETLEKKPAAEKPEPKADPQPAGEKGAKAKDEENSQTLKEDLLDLLLGPKKEKAAKEKSEAGSGKDPLDSAIEGMRTAQKRMVEKDAGKKTREIQQEVIDELEKLIQQAKQPPKSPPPQGSPPPQSKNDPKNQPKPEDDPSSKPRPESKPKPQESDSESESQSSKSKNAEKSEESSEESREAEKREAETARRKDFIKDVWGHLPPSLRQKLLNVADERSLPRYDDLVRRYFESIAEEGTKNRVSPSRPRP